MCTYSIYCAVATWLVVACISAACGPECVQSTDEEDTSAIHTVCFLPNSQELTLPDSNHQTCYNTCITEDPLFGVEDCSACFTDVDNERIKIIAPQNTELQKHFTTRIIVSPNYPAFYPSSALCMYTVECEPGQTLSYTIVDHKLQEHVNGQCMDFLDISVTADNHTRTCGDFSTIVKDTSNSGPNKLRVVFQTNRNRQNSGFMMVVTCVSPDFGDHDGCTQDVHLSWQAPSPSGRRTTETNMENVPRVIQNRFRIRKPFIKVSTDAVVSYGNNTIRVFRGSVQLHKFSKIRWLHVVNQTERLLTLSGNATEELFPGFGMLWIGLRRAVYIEGGVEPQLRLSAQERQVISSLWNGVLALHPDRLASVYFRVNDFLNTTVPSPGITARLATLTTNVNSCNAVVRANSCAVREIVQKKPCDVPSPS